MVVEAADTAFRKRTSDGNPAAPIVPTGVRGTRFPKICSRMHFPEAIRLRRAGQLCAFDFSGRDDPVLAFKSAPTEHKQCENACEDKDITDPVVDCATRLERHID